MSAEERTLPIRSDRDVALARRAVADAMDRIGAPSLRKTRFVTAASELARNALVHGGGGTVNIAVHRPPGGTGVVLVFSDKGPGIPDVKLALRDGFTTGSGMGLGLGGAQRLCDEFEIQTQAGVGTTVRVASWVRRP